MGRKRKDEELESLSNYQDTSKTGRTDGVEVSSEKGTLTLSGTAESITNVLKKAAAKANAKAKAIEITSAELVDQMFCNYKYLHTVGPNTTNKVNTKSEVPVHPDLVFAFRKLDAHLAVKCEEVDSSRIADINEIEHKETAEKINKFLVTSFTLHGSEDARSVSLFGTKELSTGEPLKLETPKILLDDSYAFATELTSVIQDCCSEVEAYMKGEKKAEDPQQELPFENGSEDDHYSEEDL